MLAFKRSRVDLISVYAALDLARLFRINFYCEQRK